MGGSKGGQVRHGSEAQSRGMQPEAQSRQVGLASMQAGSHRQGSAHKMRSAHNQNMGLCSVIGRLG